MRKTSLALVGVAFLVTATLAVRAQGPGGQAAGGAKPLVPMTASSLLRDPKAHLGDNVSLMATVDAILSKTAFTVEDCQAGCAASATPGAAAKAALAPGFETLTCAAFDDAI